MWDNLHLICSKPLKLNAHSTTLFFTVQSPLQVPFLPFATVVYRHPPRQTHPLADTPRQIPPRQTPPPPLDRQPPLLGRHLPPPRWPLQRTVRILLECIRVTEIILLFHTQVIQKRQHCQLCVIPRSLEPCRGSLVLRRNSGAFTTATPDPTQIHKSRSQSYLACEQPITVQFDGHFPFREGLKHENEIRVRKRVKRE